MIEDESLIVNKLYKLCQLNMNQQKYGALKISN